jgi:hypothetical protein
MQSAWQQLHFLIFAVFLRTQNVISLFYKWKDIIAQRDSFICGGREQIVKDTKWGPGIGFPLTSPMILVMWHSALELLFPKS